MQTCPDCNSPIVGIEEFCDNCGRPLEQPVEKPIVSTAGKYTAGGKEGGASSISGWAAPDPPYQFSGGGVAPGTCSACGYINLPGEMFCGNCGVQLAPVASAPPPPPVPVASAPSQPAIEQKPPLASPVPAPLAERTPCSVCGYINLTGEEFCSNCGVLLASPQAATPAAVPASALQQPPVAAYPPSPQQQVAPPAVAQQQPAATPAPAPQPVPPPVVQQAVIPPQPAAAPMPEPPLVTRTIPSECPVCSHPNPPGELFCKNCGYYLAVLFEAPVIPVAAPPVSEAIPPEPSPPAPGQPPEPAAGDASATQVMSPMLTMPVSVISGRLFISATNSYIPLPAQGAVTLGRPDPGRGLFPDVDVSNLGPTSSSVSRDHAHLIIEGQQLYIEDRNSTNRTYLNRQVLQPYQRYPVNNGDEMRLGGLVMIYHAA